MSRQLTVKHKMVLGFSLMAVVAVAVAAVAAYEIDLVVDAGDRVLADNVHNVMTAEKIALALEREDAALHAYLLSGSPAHLDRMRAAQADLRAQRAELEAHAFRPEEKQFLAGLTRVESEYESLAARAIDQRRPDPAADAAARDFEQVFEPKRAELERLIGGFVAHEEKLLEEATRDSSQRAAGASRIVVGLGVVAVGLAIALVLLLATGIARQIGLAIQHVQSSSAELQAAANQQAAGTKEQSAATTEVTTTLKELVATSRQMAESSQRVTRIAEDTGRAAGEGDVTLQKAQTSIAAIKRQVDLIVTHMLDLGKKSQQVGGILEIINELAEQTNILAINASIESAGAGESGRRFAVVADEIRRLADRVGGSTKEIRGLIDEIRSAANTTVMVTEDGLKAVDAGQRQFGDVASSFRQIAGMVDTTTDAAREIELGSKQQVTAIEQVNTALKDIAQAARETEASTRQTLQTSGELATLSRNLSELIRRRASLPQTA